MNTSTTWQTASWSIFNDVWSDKKRKFMLRYKAQHHLGHAFNGDKQFDAMCFTTFVRTSDIKFINALYLKDSRFEIKMVVHVK